MYIIVGLGNPTRTYEGTRHNIGFDVIRQLADKHRISMNIKKHKAICGTGYIGGSKVILAMPQTYMNLSGESVRSIADFYKVEPEEIIIIYDDVNLDVGRLRIRKKGSAGGHNGIKSIISHLGSMDFPRVRVGVGEKPSAWDLADYVLSKYTPDELPLIKEGIEDAADAVELIVNEDMNLAMNKYNGKKKVSE